MLPLRYSFGFNTNVLETNVLNLAVVIGVVITFVGDAIRVILDQRRKTILSALQEVDEKEKDAKRRLIEANQKLDIATRRTAEIRKQTKRMVEHEMQASKKRLEEDLQRLRETSLQSIQLERQRITRDITIQIGNLAIIAAENTILATLGRQSPTYYSRQKDLNEACVQEFSRQIKKNKT